MNRRTISNSSFEIHQVGPTEKIRDSPTPSILKTPTAIFVTTRNSSSKTKRLKFANGPVDLSTLRNGSHESNVSLDSGIESNEYQKLNNSNDTVFENSLIEVAISPVKKMQVSPESWKAFLEYKKKYIDYANEMEKTDYTYSRLSKFRHKEIIPGFSIRPNLCRSSIYSRRSSLSLPSSSSGFNESYHSGSYDFKVYDEPNSEISYDLKSPNQSNKIIRSKYFLRSSTFDDGTNNITSEVVSKPSSFEIEHYSNSAPEKITKTTTYSTSETPESISHYYGELRSMNLDDADLDEVDESAFQSSQANRSKHYTTSESSNAWSQTTPQTVSQHLGNFMSAIFLYFTSIGTVTKDLFSRHVLRRGNDWSQASAGWRNDKSDYLSHTGIWSDKMDYSTSSGIQNEKLAYSSPSGTWGDKLGYATASGSWIPWSSDSARSSQSYHYGSYYGQPKSLYQRCSDFFHNITNLFWGDSTRYGRANYYGTSNRRKFWWFLIPLLLLAGLWLYKAERDNGFISNQYTALDCKTNGLLRSMEESMKPVWRSGYTAYKRAAASFSCYVNDSWERLKLPFTHINMWLWSKLSVLSGTSFGYVFTFWDTLWQGLKNFISLSRDAFSYLCLFLFDFLKDFISAVNNMLTYICGVFMEGLYVVGKNLASIFAMTWKFLVESFKNLRSYLYFLLFAPKIKAKIENIPEPSSLEMCSNQKKSIEKLAKEMADFKSFSGDLSAIKKKISELELELRTEKDFRASQNEVYNRQFDENHKNLQQCSAALTLAPDTLLGQFVQTSKKELELLRTNINNFELNNLGGSDVSLAYVKKLIGDAIKLYDADKTGRVDYALETAGGQVISIRCTETYIASPKSYVLLGWSVYTKTSSPRDAISPGMAAGQCWAFVGSQGFLVIQLSHVINVTGFTMEHISKTLVPRGHIESAPKNFTMWGLKSEHDAEPHLFGEYAYLDNDETLQYFPVTYPSSKSYNIVELKITSNHGNPNYTCLYRIRVHGIIPVQILKN